MIEIDGSQGEGGGQIVRTALGLSLVTGQAVRIVRIRAGRKKPGLMRQHLTAVRAAARVGSAEVEGDALGSCELTFSPHAVNAGTFHFDVGSAGSCTLVFQTALPGLLTAGGSSELLLEGGTHNPFAPPFDFLAGAFLLILERMGVGVEAHLERHGFYPAGGGRCRIRIEAPARLERVDLLERGKPTTCRARALVSRLPRSVGERELGVVRDRLGWTEDTVGILEVPDPAGPGNALVLECAFEHVAEVFTGFGEKGKPAEAVASETVAEAERYLAAEVPVGAHLADQLLVPMALAGGGRFRTLPPTEHTRTNASVIERFLDCRVDISEAKGDACEIVVG